MVWKKLNKKGSRGGDLEIRTTPYDEIGVIELTTPPTSIYWDFEDTEQIFEEIKKAIEEHKKEKLKEVGG